MPTICTCDNATQHAASQKLDAELKATLKAIHHMDPARSDKFLKAHIEYGFAVAHDHKIADTEKLSTLAHTMLELSLEFWTRETMGTSRTCTPPTGR